MSRPAVALRCYYVCAQMTGNEDAQATFVIEHGPIANAQRLWRLMELNAAWRVAVALQNDTAQYGHLAPLLRRADAVRAAAKVRERL